MWRLRWKGTWLCFGKIRRTADFLAKMAQHRIPRHAGGPKAWVHLPQSNSDSWQQNLRHGHSTRHLFLPVTMRQLIYPKSKVCQPHMCIYILLLPVLKFSIMMHMPPIASVIQILFQICWLLKEHPLVGTLSAVWQRSWHPLCRRQQPIERTWQWRWALIKWNEIVECIIIYNYRTL